jgi:ribonuclease VapC
MVIDSSALIAILLDEPERMQFSTAIERDPSRLIAAPTLLETAMVLSAKKGDDALRELDYAILKMRMEVIPFGYDEQQVAQKAFLLYGKGRHPAGLNYGDCMSYAAAAVRGEPLLFKGEDFPRTDIAGCA